MILGQLANITFQSRLGQLAIFNDVILAVPCNVKFSSLNIDRLRNVNDVIDEGNTSVVIGAPSAIFIVVRFVFPANNVSNRVCLDTSNIPDVPVLKNINLIVNKGETIAIVGNSGGGKTTLVNLLPRFYDVTNGSITVDGIDIRDFTLKSLRQNIAVVFQDNFLFEGSIRENIMLGDENASEEQLQKAVKLAYLDEFLSTLKDGIDTQIGERGILLSGGQRQRVAIARAFLKNAPILILDEATSALDNKSEAVVQKAIENLMHDKTVFVIAHRLSTIRNASKIIVVNDGQIVETGTHEDLLKVECGAYKMLYDMQFKTNENKKSDTTDK